MNREFAVMGVKHLKNPWERFQLDKADIFNIKIISSPLGKGLTASSLKGKPNLIPF
jgi:hypothetical protein